MLLTKIQHGPTNGFVICNRGVFLASQGEFASAIKEWTNELALDPNDTMALSNIAWIRSTCRDDALRNGKQAIEYAIKACELSEWKHPGFLETLAAAYAEIGDFLNALK